MKLKRKDLLILYFEALEWKVDEHYSSSKYIRMSHARKDGYRYLGKSGAVRVGKTIDSSISVTDMYNNEFLEEWYESCKERGEERKNETR